MNFTRTLLSILALASFTLVFAEDGGKAATHHPADSGMSMHRMGAGNPCTPSGCCAESPTLKPSDQESGKPPYYTLEGLHHL